MLTLANLACGCVGIVCTFAYPKVQPIIFALIGCVFDYLDGFAARRLDAQSKLGLELDSLADLITSGVFPSVVMYQVLVKTTGGNEIIPFFAFSIAIFSAYRLAKFNVSSDQKENFIGLPTPACGLFLIGLPLIGGTLGGYIHNT